MQSKIFSVTLMVASGLALTLPVMMALHLAQRRSVLQESRHALTMAGEILSRTEAAASQCLAAERRLHEPEAEIPCSPASISRMRDLALDGSYIEVIGHVADDRLMCSSLGNHGEGIPLGPWAYESTLGVRVRPSVELGSGAMRSFLVFERGGYVAAIHPDALIDIYDGRPDVSLGVLGQSTGTFISRRGSFDPESEERFQDPLVTTYFDGKDLVAIQRSETLDFVAYVAVPAASLQASLRALEAVFLPVALVLGAGMAFLCFHVAKQRASLPSVLRGALKRSEFEVHYQPIFELSTRHIAGFEALLRWPQPDGSFVRPDLFIPAAEDCELIHRFTEFVLDRVAVDGPRLLAAWPEAYVSINLSARDLGSDGIVRSLGRLARSPGIEGHNLVVEATEHSFVDPLVARRIVQEIRGLGIRVAIDDFGTGFSSLSYLMRLQTDLLKIDRSFVEAVGTDSVTREVALHIIRVAGSLGLEVVGEGIETEAQANFLCEHRVRYGQGWLFSKAMPVQSLLSRLVPAEGLPTAG